MPNEAARFKLWQAQDMYVKVVHSEDLCPDRKNSFWFRGDVAVITYGSYGYSVDEFKREFTVNSLVIALRHRGIDIPKGAGIQFINDNVLTNRDLYQKYRDVDLRYENEKILSRINKITLNELMAFNRNLIDRGDPQKSPKNLSCTYPAAKELRKITLTVQGVIEIVFGDDPDNIYQDGDAVKEALHKGYTDADLTEEDRGGKIRKGIHNNYFVFGYESSKWDGRHNISFTECGGDTFTNYDKGIKFGNDIIADDQRWSDYTWGLVPKKKKKDYIREMYNY